MAILSIRYLSEVLERKVTFAAVIPDGWKTGRTERCRTLYLLHGYRGDQQDWLENTRLEQMAQASRYAVILPAGENSYYADQRYGFPYGRFIGEELVRVSRSLFPLSEKSEDTVIAGLSMGGYGALRNGLHYDKVFGRIGAFSSTILTASPSVRPADEGRHEEVRRMLLGTQHTEALPPQMDIVRLAERRKQEGNFPPLFLACGREDHLFGENEQFHAYLTEENIPHEYRTAPGAHEWDYWAAVIREFFEWLEPDLSRSLPKVR